MFPDSFDLYGEPFFGGGAVFWEKEPSPVEVINDTNHQLVNFYSVVKEDFKPLQKEIEKVKKYGKPECTSPVFICYL